MCTPTGTKYLNNYGAYTDSPNYADMGTVSGANASITIGNPEISVTHGTFTIRIPETITCISRTGKVGTPCTRIIEIEFSI